jgi:alpha-N-acetylglucosaminidase
VALLRGVYAYLKENGFGMITWSGRRLELPAHLPDMPLKRVVCPNRFVQYLNPCAFGYSAAFWDWPRWERELDWMAIHGINLPLAMEGQEAIWQTVWSGFGVTQAEWNRFTTGPAHLPWHRMGNINRFDGPLPQTWIDQKKELQKQILGRMLELGMTPIVPGFAGHVPEAFLRIYPEARIFTLLWGGEPATGVPRESRTFLLHPAEAELFQEIGRRFITEYKREFQTGEYYLADTFNELPVPASRQNRYADLKAFGRNIYDSIRAGDPNGKWVMQGWIFANDPKNWDAPSTAAFLSGVPPDRVLIIDYSADMDSVHEVDYHDAPDAWKRLNAFYGRSWIAGMAHTFGGNNNVKGNLPLIADKPFEIARSPARGNLLGWGIDMEGIESNEVVYELMTDVGWSSTRIDLSAWLPVYCRARYGADPPAMTEAWQYLLGSAYSTGIWKTHHAFQGRPSLDPRPQFVDSGPVFRRAVDLFCSCAGELRGSQLYVNDLIELVVQAAGGAVDRLLADACRFHKDGNTERRDQTSAQALRIMTRIDSLLNDRPDRRLETWVGRARDWARTADEAAYYDRSARCLITYWGWRELEDYASRLYSGLVRDYYCGRWQAFFGALANNAKFSLDEWELQWLSTPYRPSSAIAVRDVVADAQSLLMECKSLLS